MATSWSWPRRSSRRVDDRPEGERDPPAGLLAHPREAPLGRLHVPGGRGLRHDARIVPDAAGLHRDGPPADRDERTEDPAVPGGDDQRPRLPERLLPDAVRPDPEPPRGARGDRQPAPGPERRVPGRRPAG